VSVVMRDLLADYARGGPHQRVDDDKR
jgi:hypothetical protein